jgi:uncharacterized protein DUF3106
MARVERWLCGGLLLIAAGAAALPPALQARLAHLPASAQQELRARDARWMAFSPRQQQALRARMAAWDALPEAERQRRRGQWQAWQAMPAPQRAQLQAAAIAFASLPAQQQQTLRAQFAALDATAQRGWLLGPALGSDYTRLQPLLLQVPGAQRDRLLAVLQSMTSTERADLGRLAQRTPPQQRDALRRALLSTSAINRAAWLQSELER